MIRLASLILEREADWCSDKQFLEFVDYLEKWQSHATYRGVKIDKLVRSFNQLDREIQRAITASDREVKSSYSAIDMDSLYDSNKLKVQSFTDKRGAEYFSKQLTDNPVISGKHIDKYKLAISYPKVVSLCKSLTLGDDEGEILIIEPEFNKRWLDSYWAERIDKSEQKSKARENARELILQYNTFVSDLVDKYDIPYSTSGPLGLSKEYHDQLLSDMSQMVRKLFRNIEVVYKEDFKKFVSDLSKIVTKVARKADRKNLKSFFKELDNKIQTTLHLEHPNITR